MLLMNNYEKQCILKKEDVAGIGPWIWIANDGGHDGGAWGGPKQDFENSHYHAYKKHIEKWDVVVQAGGCQGMYPRLFSEMFGRVYTFEPDPLNFFVLTINCQRDNIIKMQTALGAENKLITVSRNSPQNYGMHTISERQQFIPMIKLDTLNLDACDFIQLDVEGYEIFALRGAEETIKKFKPVISCERGNREIIDFLTPFGYTAVEQTMMDTIYKINK